MGAKKLSKIGVGETRKLSVQLLGASPNMKEALHWHGQLRTLDTFLFLGAAGDSQGIRP